MRITNWQRTDGARKKPPRNVPEPFPRPHDAEKKKPSADVGDRVNVGGTVATVTTVEDFMTRRAEREKRWRAKHDTTKEGEG